jgi:hypothetical protein
MPINLAQYRAICKQSPSRCLRQTGNRPTARTLTTTVPECASSRERAQLPTLANTFDKYGRRSVHRPLPSCPRIATTIRDHGQARHGCSLCTEDWLFAPWSARDAHHTAHEFRPLCAPDWPQDTQEKYSLELTRALDESCK